LVEYSHVAEAKTEFTITCSGSNRGIYIREPLDLGKPSVVACTVTPLHYDGISGRVHSLSSIII